MNNSVDWMNHPPSLQGGRVCGLCGYPIHQAQKEIDTATVASRTSLLAIWACNKDKHG